jgi:hypothetical protein
MITMVRQDLADLDSTNYRWTDAVLAREIDRAVDKYSSVAPQMILSQIPTKNGARLYQAPFNTWWIERIEYPTGRWPKQWVTWKEWISPPIFDPLYANPYFTGVPQFSAAAVSGGGSLYAGTYQYAFSWATPGGETLTSAVISIAAAAGGSVQLSNIPTGPYGVVDINIYRTQVNGSALLFAGNLGTNIGAAGYPQPGSGTNLVATTSYTDKLADASLGAAAPTLNTTAGNAIVELQLDSSRLPQDNTGLIEITAGAKHELDQYGTTIPEKHWDAIALGAEAFACWQYVTAVNDNFDYVDGQFRDRVDDTKSAIAWRHQAEDTMARFNARLTEIRNQIELTTPSYPQWGDKPVRWDRL